MSNAVALENKTTETNVTYSNVKCNRSMLFDSVVLSRSWYSRMIPIAFEHKNKFVLKKIVFYSCLSLFFVCKRTGRIIPKQKPPKLHLKNKPADALLPSKSTSKIKMCLFFFFKTIPRLSY